MKRTLFILATIIAIVFNGTAQNLKCDSIEVKKVFGGYKFFFNNKKITTEKLLFTMKSNEPAYLEMKSSQKFNIAGIVTGSVGGFLLGLQIGNATKGNTPKWEMVALGSVISLLSIPLNMQAVKRSKKAVDLYNSSLSQTSFWKKEKPELHFCFGVNNIALNIKFH
ncbi:MAG: hypothetical protein RL308_1834 [Bacteroidota bacterium]|jgi:hypothetical protein